MPTVETDFPDTTSALQEPNGLLAMGGVLSVELLLKAYPKGIFPWYMENEPLLWWSPNPRMVLFPEKFKQTNSLTKIIRNKSWTATYDQDFAQVITKCRKTHQQKSDTWITKEMLSIYQKMFIAGYAHSVEVWNEKQELIGGLYGIALGKIFFGESMFSLVPNASKVALAYLCKWLQEWQYQLIDCQVYTEHLKSLGAELIARETFEQFLQKYTPVVIPNMN